MFYDLFKQLAEERGVSVHKAATDIGLSKSTATKWKKTAATPQGDTLQKIADYFGVSIDYLLTGEEQKEKAPTGEGEGVNPELKEVLEYYQNKPGMKLLFSVSRDATPEDIIDAAEKIEEAKRRREQGGE